jgi:hypothetical protein
MPTNENKIKGPSDGPPIKFTSDCCDNVCHTEGMRHGTALAGVIAFRILGLYCIVRVGRRMAELTAENHGSEVNSVTRLE